MTKIWTHDEEENDYVARYPQNVVGGLPPGYYTSYEDRAGNMHFTPKEFSTDTLYNFPGSYAQKVVDELKDFWGKSERYAKHGLTHKRGILLHGPAGTGKTSILNMVISEATQLGAVLLNFGSETVDAIRTIRNMHPNMPVVIMLEDVDRWCHGGAEEHLLNLLDGSDQFDNVTFIGTTNYLERIPARLANRPSRFDTLIKVGLPTAKMRAHYLSKLFERKITTTDKHVTSTGDLSFAHLREYFIATEVLGQTSAQALRRLRR